MTWPDWKTNEDNRLKKMTPEIKADLELVGQAIKEEAIRLLGKAEYERISKKVRRDIIAWECEQQAKEEFRRRNRL